MSTVFIHTPEGVKLFDEMNQALAIDVQAQPGRLLFSTPGLGVSVDSDSVDLLLRFLHQWAIDNTQLLERKG